MSFVPIARPLAICSLGIRQFLRLADTGDDVLHVVDGNGLDALLVQFCKEFRDTGFDIVYDLVATVLFSKRRAQRLNILLQHFIGILIDLEEAPAQVDGNVLLHFASNNWGVMFLR